MTCTSYLMRTDELFNWCQYVYSLSGRNDKEDFIAATASSEIQRFLKLMYDPFITFGIKEDKLFKHVPLKSHHEGPIKLMHLLEYLKESSSGTNSDIAMCQQFLHNTDEEFKPFVVRCITKTLRLGVNSASLNKIFGAGFIAAPGLMLAHKLQDHLKYLQSAGMFTVTEKLDGVRATWNGEHFYSRSGRVIEGLTQLEEELQATGCQLPLDGELTLKGNGICSDTAGYLKRKGTKTNVVFNVFDVKFEEYSYHERRTYLSKVFEATDHAILLPTLYRGRVIEALYIAHDIVKSRGGEGVMINIDDALYQPKRTKDLLKLKTFYDIDIVVEGVEEGQGAFDGILGALWCDHNGVKVKVGSGFEVDERARLWAEKDTLPGRVVTVQYFEETRDGSLRFPVFKKFKEEIER